MDKMDKEEVKNLFTPILLMFRDGQANLEISLERLYKVCQFEEKCKECEYDPQAAEFSWFLNHGWLPPAEVEKKDAEIERIIGWMEGKCLQHWANSTPFRWRCVECWQALKDKYTKEVKQ